MELTVQDNGNERLLRFVPIPLVFRHAESAAPKFSSKNNKTVAETIQHRRYATLAAKTREHYPEFLEHGLGDFLAALRARGDSFYRRFLNPHGDQTYCVFTIEDRAHLYKRGLYAYLVSQELRYIGRCRDTFKNRINNGYGRISAKNCYIDGQSTNCHLNALVTSCQDAVTFEVCELFDVEEICRLEAALIVRYQPRWNIQLKRAESANGGS